MLGRCKEIKDNFESRGFFKFLEYGVYEVRFFGEMLLKGSVIILEVNDVNCGYLIYVFYMIFIIIILIIGKINILYEF